MPESTRSLSSSFLQAASYFPFCSSATPSSNSASAAALSAALVCATAVVLHSTPSTNSSKTNGDRPRPPIDRLVIEAGLYLGSPRVSPLLRHKSTFPGWRQRSGAPTEAIRAWLLAGAQDLEAVYAHLTELLFGRRLLGGSSQDH